MSEFIDAILNPINLVLTILLGMFVLYWVSVCLGAIDMDALDVDLDVDLDADADLDGSHHAIPGSGFLRFFNLGEVPLMVLLSVFVLVLWAVGVASHRYIGGWSVLMQLLVLLPMILAAALLTKLATAPLKKVFRELEASQHTGEIDFIGMRCTVASLSLDQRHGQVEVQTDGSPIKLSAYLESEHAALQRGDEAVIVSHDKERGVYRVRGF